MSQHVALLDACVLYPAPIRDLLMWLSIEHVYQPKWSETIHEEWITNVLLLRPDLSADQLQRTCDLMLANNPNALVMGFERHIPTLNLPDFDDRHVLAAAIEGHADVIVTFNLKDFPEALLAPYGIEAIHPDAFVCQCFLDYPRQALTAIHKQQQNLKSPSYSMAQLLDILSRVGLPINPQLHSNFAYCVK